MFNVRTLWLVHCLQIRPHLTCWLGVSKLIERQEDEVVLILSKRKKEEERGREGGIMVNSAGYKVNEMDLILGTLSPADMWKGMTNGAFGWVVAVLVLFCGRRRTGGSKSCMGRFLSRKFSFHAVTFFLIRKYRVAASRDCARRASIVNSRGIL